MGVALLSQENKFKFESRLCGQTSMSW